MGITSGLVAGMVGRAASGVASIATMVIGLSQWGQLRVAVGVSAVGSGREGPAGSDSTLSLASSRSRRQRRAASALQRGEQ
jgi:hypothetical protein